MNFSLALGLLPEAVVRGVARPKLNEVVVFSFVATEVCAVRRVPNSTDTCLKKESRRHKLQEGYVQQPVATICLCTTRICFFLRRFFAAMKTLSCLIG